MEVSTGSPQSLVGVDEVNELIRERMHAMRPRGCDHKHKGHQHGDNLHGSENQTPLNEHLAMYLQTSISLQLHYVI